MRIIREIRNRIAILRQDCRGLALVEFAYSLPLLLILSMGGLELANYALTNMRISQATMAIADNASRIGDRDALVAQKIYETDIEDIFQGIKLQAGKNSNIFENGRVIVSSLEQNPEGGQWIHWQRCMGEMRVESSYGLQGEGATGTDFAGMGKPGMELTAPANGAVIFVEVIYDYPPMMTNEYAIKYVNAKTIRSTAAFSVRGTRDLSQIYPGDPATDPRLCSKYDAS